MYKNFKFLLTIVTLFLFGCAKGSYRENQDILINYYSNNDFNNIEKKVLDKNFLPGEENVLLKNLEVGKAYYNNDKYCSAIEFFNKSGIIIEEQQTKSISKAISSSLGAGDDIFYGESYEQSLLNFYKSLINYEIFARGFCEHKNIDGDKLKNNIDSVKLRYLSNEDRMNYLFSSRSNILYWDSWINGRYIDEYDKLYYKDLLLKLWGAFVHEQFGDRNNLNIAKQLYIDAKDIATNRYAVYKTFNSQNLNFIKYLKDIKKRSEYIEYNNTYLNDIIEYCDRQLNRLQEGKKVNFAVILSDDKINHRTAKTIRVPILSFLGMLSGNVKDLIIALNLDNATYELPTISSKTANYKYFYLLKQGDNIITQKPIVLSEPISDINFMNLYEKFEKIQSSIITSVTAKYIALLTPIAITYAISKKSKNNLVKLSALAVAISAYKAGEYAITKSGLVDIRHWVGLPSNIFMVTDNIEKGKYELNIIKRVNGSLNDEIIYKNNIEIGENVSFFDLKF